MKKVISLLLSAILAFSVCTAVPAYAYDYDSLTFAQGKKRGEIIGFIEDQRRTVQAIEGGDEVVDLILEAHTHIMGCLDKLREATIAAIEVEKDKAELDGIYHETYTDEANNIAEGLGSSMGDPSGCARDLDVIVADCDAAFSDAELAVNNNNFKTAVRAMLEFNDAGETFYDKFYKSVGDIDIYYANIYDTESVYYRLRASLEKAEADLNKANALLDEAKAEADSVVALYETGYNKALTLVENAPADKKADFQKLADECTHADEVYDDLGVKWWERESIDFSAYDRCIDEMYRALPHIMISDYKAKISSLLLPEFFMTANELTFNGQEQPLVTMGRNIPGEEGKATTFALGAQPEKYYDGIGYTADVRDSDTASLNFTEGIPTAKDPGTYFVYCKFADADYTVMATKVVIRKAPSTPVIPEETPAKKPAKSANTLTARGKTVKLKFSKKNRSVAAKKAVSVKKAKGKVTYKKIKGNKKITVAKTGKITVKKGLKKGTYIVKIKVTAAGNKDFKAGSKTVKVTIKIK